MKPELKDGKYVEIADDRPRWEYHCISSNFGDTYQSFTDKLNQAGYEGQEVINIAEVKDNNVMNISGYAWTAWLKRRYRFERLLDYDYSQDQPIEGRHYDYIYYV